MVHFLPQAPAATGQQVNRDILFNVVRAIAGEHRQLLISIRETDIEQKLFFEVVQEALVQVSKSSRTEELS